MACRSNGFKHTGQQAEKLTAETLAYFATHEGAVELFCRDCDFFKEDERVMECNALKVLRKLLQKGLLKAEDLREAVRE